MLHVALGRWLVIVGVVSHVVSKPQKHCRATLGCLIYRATDGGAIDIAGYAAALGTTTSGFGKCIVYIGNSTFHNNSAMTSTGHDASFASSSFNTLPGSGGSIRMIGAALWIEDTTSGSNQADSLGGAILFEQSCTPVSSSWAACTSSPKACTNV